MSEYPNAVATMQGRELDGMVHQHLFGVRSYPGAVNKNEWYCDQSDWMNPVPHYTTDPAAFFAMVEAVRAKCAGVDMAWGPDGDWHIWLALDASASRAVTATADTLPLAFARAALLACLSDDANQKGG